MKNGIVVTSARAMELDKKSVKEAKKGEQVALSMDGVTMGRQLLEGDTLYSSINEEEFKRLKEIKDLLTKDQIEVMKEIAEIMRKGNPGWGL
jgi:translation initiation factor 5B